MANLIPGAWASHTVTDGEGERLDAYLAKAFPEITRSRGQKLIDEEFVRRNGGAAKANPMVTAITASTSFVVTGQALDTSTYNYVIIKNAA